MRGKGGKCGEREEKRVVGPKIKKRWV